MRRLRPREPDTQATRAMKGGPAVGDWLGGGSARVGVPGEALEALEVAGVGAGVEASGVPPPEEVVQPVAASATATTRNAPPPDRDRRVARDADEPGRPASTDVTGR